MSQYSYVTDELLSAYLDDAVTASERTLVEAAVANDPDIAWRLMTLQYTVDLLGKLPDIALPRSFTLSEAMVAMESTGSQALRPASRPVREPQSAGFWASWRSFWQGGNLFLRNAAVASLAAFLVLSVGGFAFVPAGAPPSVISSEPAAFQTAGSGKEADAVSSIQSQADNQPSVASSASLIAMTEAASPSASPADVAKGAPASQDQSAESVAPPPAPASAEAAPAPPSQPAEAPVVESAAEAAPAAAQSQAETATPPATEVVMAAAVAAMSDAQNAAAEEAAASDETSARLQEPATQSTTLASTRTEEAAATDLGSAPLAATNEASGPAEETTSGEAAAPASMAAVEDAGAAPPAIADEPIAQPAEESPLPAAERPAESAPAVALASAPESAPAVAQESVSPDQTSQPAPAKKMGPTLFQYLQLLALAIALAFAGLWLLSRRNAPASR